MRFATQVKKPQVDDLIKVADLVHRYNKQVEFWGDIAVEHPEIIPRLRPVTGIGCLNLPSWCSPGSSLTPMRPNLPICHFERRRAFRRREKSRSEFVSPARSQFPDLPAATPTAAPPNYPGSPASAYCGWV
jgi:hypothetical protein